MYSAKLYSPLRYPGGKAAFAPFIANLMKLNKISGGHYLEPYAGGAGVALELLFHGHASHIHINDLDPAIHAFWESVVHHSDELLDLLWSTPITIEEWYKWRSILRDSSNGDIVEKGFATLFVNRTNRSGILNAGVIGGKDQLGKYKLDARFKKEDIAARIKNIADKKHKISVYCMDSLDILECCADILPKKSLVYLDPPYYKKGKQLYRNFYNHNDHVNIAKMIQKKSFKWPWIVSYDNTEEICKMYKNSLSISYGINYTAQHHYTGNEIMFFSEKINRLV
jgi:D12 class N6 adenine-specific DNA methyltransferase